MTEGLPLCSLEIVFYSSRSAHFKDWVTWNKDQKTLTSIYCSTRQEDGSSERSLCGAPEAFEDYKGKNLRVKLNGKQVTLSVRGDVPTYNAEGYFQIAYSECKEGWLAKEVFFEVQNLTEWLYSEMWEKPFVNVSKDFGNQSEGLNKWLKDKKTWFALLEAGELSLFYVKTQNASLEEFKFKYLNEDFTCTLYDEWYGGCESPFRFSYERKCYFEIKSSREHDREFFETLIRKITHFLSLLFGKRAVANHIWESDKQQYRWNYNPSEKENPGDFCYVGIPYSAISGEFGNKLTQWLSKYERYGTIIDCFFRDSPKVLPEPKTNNISAEEKRNIFEIFFKRCQLLETYGNISTKGKNKTNTTNDLREAAKAVDKKEWGVIIRDIGNRIQDFRIFPDSTHRNLYFYSFGDTPEQQKEEFVRIVMAFRNYFVHPFFDGKKKTPSSEGIAKFFTTEGYGPLENFPEVINRLSKHLSVILRCVFLESKNARENKGVTKLSQNLFSDPNRKREDYGKVILEYLQKCLAYEETAKKISKALSGIKSILLYSSEDAARKTPCDEISGSQSTNIVPTEEQLKCLSDILTELTWRCKKTPKELFGKDEGQENWASRPICECIMDDFSRGSKKSSVKWQSLGELISNLKKSFDPNTGSLLCEQFTNYRDAEVNFKALTALTNGCLKILWQLLLQKAGLTEFFKKKRMHRVPCRINV